VALVTATHANVGHAPSSLAQTLVLDPDIIFDGRAVFGAPDTSDPQLAGRVYWRCGREKAVLFITHDLDGQSP
jgi:hypothetical protein